MVKKIIKHNGYKFYGFIDKYKSDHDWSFHEIDFKNNKIIPILNSWWICKTCGCGLSCNATHATFYNVYENDRDEIRFKYGMKFPFYLRSSEFKTCAEISIMDILS